MNEFALIKEISGLRSAAVKKKKFGLFGIGDDCAVIPVDKKKSYLVSVDNLFENVHFNLKHCSLFELGAKSVKVNVSDIISTGGVPKYILISINIPEKIKIKDFFKGCDSVCSKYNIKIIGGDTSASSSGLCVSVTIIGLADNKNILRRDGANPEEMICMTGYSGLSAAGFYFLNKQKQKNISNMASRFHNNPEIPDLHDAAIIRNNAVAAMDNSDGLYFTLYTMLKNSGVGGNIFFDKIPLHPYAAGFCSENNFNSEDFINFGEDYNCVFTMNPKKQRCLTKMRCKVSIIGMTNSTNKIILNNNGINKILQPAGFNHDV